LGATLLSTVLVLNEAQESSLGLVFHYADKNGLALLDLKDVAGVILRELITFSDQGADVFWGAEGAAQVMRCDALETELLGCRGPAAPRTPVAVAKATTIRGSENESITPLPRQPGPEGRLEQARMATCLLRLGLGMGCLDVPHPGYARSTQFAS